MSSQKTAKVEEMIAERNDLSASLSEVENQIFKIESQYLDFSQGNSLFRNLEFYIHTKPEKKKGYNENNDRIFSTGFPV